MTIDADLEDVAQVSFTKTFIEIFIDFIVRPPSTSPSVILVA